MSLSREGRIAVERSVVSDEVVVLEGWLYARLKPVDFVCSVLVTASSLSLSLSSLWPPDDPESGTYTYPVTICPSMAAVSAWVQQKGLPAKWAPKAMFLAS